MTKISYEKRIIAILTGFNGPLNRNTVPAMIRQEDALSDLFRVTFCPKIENGRKVMDAYVDVNMDFTSASDLCAYVHLSHETITGPKMIPTMHFKISSDGEITYDKTSVHETLQQILDMMWVMYSREANVVKNIISIITDVCGIELSHFCVNDDGSVEMEGPTYNKTTMTPTEFHDFIEGIKRQLMVLDTIAKGALK